MNCRKYDRPLSRWSTTDLVQHVQRSGLVASVSGSTLWRWLHEDAIRPWHRRSWIFPRDPVCRPRTPMHVEHEYFRCGAWTYIAALDVHHARIFGRCESNN